MGDKKLKAVKIKSDTLDQLKERRGHRNCISIDDVIKHLLNNDEDWNKNNYINRKNKGKELDKG